MNMLAHMSCLCCRFKVPSLYASPQQYAHAHEWLKLHRLENELDRMVATGPQGLAEEVLKRLGPQLADMNPAGVASLFGHL